VTGLSAVAYLLLVQWMFSLIIKNNDKPNGLSNDDQYHIAVNWLDINSYTLDTGQHENQNTILPPFLGLDKLLGTGKALKCIGLLSIDKSPMSNFVYRVRGAATYSVPNDGVLKGGAEQIDMHVPIYSYYSHVGDNYMLMYSKVVNDITAKSDSFLPSGPLFKYNLAIPQQHNVQSYANNRDAIYYTNTASDVCEVNKFDKDLKLSDHYLVNTYEELAHSISQFGTFNNTTYEQHKAKMTARELESLERGTGLWLNSVFRSYRKRVSDNMKLLDDFKKSRQ